MAIKITGKQVIIRQPNGAVIEGHAQDENEVGVWVLVASNSALRESIPKTIQTPVIFFPFCQMLWLVTSSTQAGR
jgi:hypothetical protein